ncbi:MAG: Hsp70 family protein, partial [Pseudobutyrivibrio sp.]|nr:Hsp70 family protein [Pseudobutyrivibrio sp.]
ITITAGSNMSDEDIDKAVKEAQEYEAQDKKRKEAVDTRNDVESFVFQTKKALDEVGDKIDAADKSAVEADIEAAQKLLDQYQTPEEMSDSQIGELKAAQEKLTESAQKVFAKMYEQSQAGAGAAGAQGADPDMSQFTGAGAGAGSNPADDVVDADFKEV